MSGNNTRVDGETPNIRTICAAVFRPEMTVTP
jgi:hypothetical protein